MHYAKWEKLDSEGHTLQGSTYETSGGDKTTGQNTDQLLAGAGGGGAQWQKGTEELSRRIGMSHILSEAVVTQLSVGIKLHGTTSKMDGFYCM